MKGNRNPRPGAAAEASRPDLGWQDAAACKGEDTELSFEPGHYENPRTRRRREAKAKAICAGCPVRSPCLEFGLGTPHGLWGGLSEMDRQRLKRRRQLRRRAEQEEIAS
jgi:WhiB family redox-sensing transcriptional regulator